MQFRDWDLEAPKKPETIVVLNDLTLILLVPRI